MLSRNCKYAIHALVYLAERYPSQPIQIHGILDKCDIPRKFLGIILLELKNAGILNSRKGKTGGYCLRKEPASVHLVDVIRLTNGSLALLPCVSLNYYERCEECMDETTCSIRDTFSLVRAETLRVLRETTLEKLVRTEQQLKEYKPPIVGG